MNGGIYSDQRCGACGSHFRDNHKNALSCPNHPDQRAHHLKVKFKSTIKRFSSYVEADQFLNGLRFLATRGKYDPRDYRRDNPLSFANLVDKFVDAKRPDVKPKTLQSIERHLMMFADKHGHLNVKDIDYGTLEDFKTGLGLSSKSIHNVFIDLKAFFMWCRKRVGKGYEPPEFPETPYLLGYRNITSKHEQARILEEVKRISGHDHRIWFGIKLLATYHSIRPGELLNINDGDWLFGIGVLRITKTKTKDYRPVPILEEDLEIAKSFMDPKVDTRLLPFFRNRWGRRAGHNAFYNVWKQACKNLGIEGLDLYGGTKHTTCTALKQYFSPEEIKKASMIKGNKEFDRYLRINDEDLRRVYAKSAADTALTPIIDLDEKRKLLKTQEETQ